MNATQSSLCTSSSWTEQPTHLLISLTWFETAKWTTHFLFYFALYNRVLCESPWAQMVRKRFWGRGAYFLMSTVVTVNFTPFSHKTMKSLWQKGQFPTFSPSCPAWRDKKKYLKKTPYICDCTILLTVPVENFQHFFPPDKQFGNERCVSLGTNSPFFFHVDVKSSCFCRKKIVFS